MSKADAFRVEKNKATEMISEKKSNLRIDNYNSGGGKKARLADCLRKFI